MGGEVTQDGELVFKATDATGNIAVAPTDTGVEFRVVLNAPNQATSYSFALDLGDLEATLDPDGSLVLAQINHGEGQFTSTMAGRIGAPVLVDANGLAAPDGAVTVSLYRPLPGSEPPPDVSKEALAALKPGEVVVTYRIDPNWLAEECPPEWCDLSPAPDLR